MDKIASKTTPRFKKGDAFVEMAPHPLVFMEVNEVEVRPGNKDFCIVTWYSLDENGLNASVDSQWLLAMVSSATSSRFPVGFSER